MTYCEKEQTLDPHHHLSGLRTFFDETFSYRIYIWIVLLHICINYIHNEHVQIMRCEANDMCTWLSEANGQDMAIISIASSSSGVHQQTIDRTKLLIAYNSVQEFCFLSQFEVIVYS